MNIEAENNGTEGAGTQDTNQSAQTVVHKQGQVLANIVDAMEGKENTHKKRADSLGGS